MVTEQCSLLEDLEQRGMIAQQTGDGELVGHLNKEVRTVYCGFDPTADSLHIGSLVPLLALKRFQMAGHKPIALVGGATGLIGDPSFKVQERKLNTPDIVADWVEKLKDQVGRFIDFECGENSAVVVNNIDWVGQLDVLTFLRDVGKHFSVSSMIQKESVKQRLEREGEGISYTEFTYMILQSYDFAELNKRHGCTVQLGGSDQFGNIVGGIDLTRRLNRQQVFGITLPLVTKADGTKFGKTEAGTIWLDSKKTSQYAFYQFWVNTADADVYKFLRYFTFLSTDEIGEIERLDQQSEGRPQAQGILACEVTKLIHGEAGLAAAIRISEALFSGKLSELSQSDLEQLQLDGLPTLTIKREGLVGPLTALLTECGLVSSGKQVKDALASKAVLINGEAKSFEDNMKLQQCFALGKAMHGKFYIVKLGKKKYCLLVVE